LEIICENDVLISLKLTDKFEKDEKETDFIKDVKKQLNEYFSGKRKIFNIKINPSGIEFQKNVWNELKKSHTVKQKVILKLLRQLEIKIHKERPAMPAVKIR